ncbi:SDR family NAD(P)-dependent oxidoreductase [Sphingomonas solaris]|uniref:SDR family NAD(P)-dependent oxidoreductase n=1 Tax=Alterirhizorhabdus solaris TaxID=2529389 RepID=A0A558QRU1_9SPHN|nr:SDR family NAD(P)-dependent oxidoreductase [Sphingomonas solaris]TVV69824.1 SDR family NAD(P)-dependent oxidoreductase [Sphingomonas solaris]
MTDIAFITGASSGFGAAIARRFVADGRRVIAAARRRDRLDALAAELGDALLPLTLDVTDADAVAALPGSLPEEWRDVAILVNNAGLALGTAPAHQTSLADWTRMIATNVSGLVGMTHALLPGMVARGRGHVVNLGSVAANYPYPGGNVYGATKAFVQQFTLGLKADLAGSGVRVSDVQPGLVGGTEFSNVRMAGDDAKAAAVYADTVPMTAEDVAEAVSWIVGLPPHLNVNRIELMPDVQGPGPFTVKRG